VWHSGEDEYVSCGIMGGDRYVLCGIVGRAGMYCMA